MVGEPASRAFQQREYPVAHAGRFLAELWGGFKALGEATSWKDQNAVSVAPLRSRR